MKERGNVPLVSQGGDKPAAKRKSRESPKAETARAARAPQQKRRRNSGPKASSSEANAAPAGQQRAPVRTGRDDWFNELDTAPSATLVDVNSLDSALDALGGGTTAPTAAPTPDAAEAVLDELDADDDNIDALLAEGEGMDGDDDDDDDVDVDDLLLE